MIYTIDSLWCTAVVVMQYTCLCVYMCACVSISVMSLSSVGLGRENGNSRAFFKHLISCVCALLPFFLDIKKT